MAYELKDGFGQLFKNDNKSADNQPDYKGTMKTPNGEELEIGAWIKEGAKGKFFSLKISPKFVKEEKPSQSTNEVKYDDTLPF